MKNRRTFHRTLRLSLSMLLAAALLFSACSASAGWISFAMHSGSFQEQLSVLQELRYLRTFQDRDTFSSSQDDATGTVQWTIAPLEPAEAGELLGQIPLAVLSMTYDAQTQTVALTTYSFERCMDELAQSASDEKELDEERKAALKKARAYYEAYYKAYYEEQTPYDAEREEALADEIRRQISESDIHLQ